MSGKVVIAALAAATSLPSREAHGCVAVNGTLTISGTVTTDCVTVNGTIVIRAGGRLVLTGGTTSTINGSIILEGAGSELAVTALSHTLSGSGVIVGQNENAAIYVASGVTLTSTMTISGVLTIHGGGGFVNQGVVNANACGTLLITVNSVDDSSGTNRWKCTAANAVLRFTDPAGASIGTFGPMQGQFVLTAGEIEVNTALTTAGPLQISAGLFDINADVTMGSMGNPLEMSGGAIGVVANASFVHN